MTASTVAQYLAALPADRRVALSAARKAINENLPDGYEEGMQFGMIGWYVPLSVYPAGYGENPKVRCHWLRSHRRSRAWCCISCRLISLRNAMTTERLILLVAQATRLPRHGEERTVASCRLWSGIPKRC